MNASLQSACVPECHKKAIVTPLLKKDNLDANNLKNFRPVSNLPFISKILEKVVAKQLVIHMSNNNMQDSQQSAYRAGHSTESALIKVKSDIDTALGEGDGILLLLLDLSAAFDTVDHLLLLERLERLLGVTGDAKRWIHSYLTSRSQMVSIGNAQSEAVALTTGVPQGSVLGPLLFLVYVLPLGAVIDSHRVNRHGYADDSQLYLRFSLRHVSAIFQAINTLQNCAEDVRRWMILNKLRVNDDKTEFLIIAPKQYHTMLQGLNVNIVVGQASVAPCSSVRDLGAILDRHMTMIPQVSNVVQGMYTHIRRIAKIRHNLDQPTCATLINALVLSRLDFHNGLLVNLPNTTLQPLKLAQNAAARLVTGAKKRDHVGPLYNSLHWLPVHSRIMYKILVLVYKTLYNCASPKYMSDMLSIYTPVRSLRSSTATLLLNKPKCLKAIGERSFTVAGPSMWNSLPDSLRATATLETFKRHLKTYLFDL